VLQLTSLGGSLGVRGAAVVGSVVLHGALLFTALGHPSSSRGSDAARTIDVDVTAPQVPLADLVLAAPLAKDETTAPHAHESPAYPHHTHPYPVPPSHDWTPHDPNMVHVFPPTLPAAAAVAPLAAESPPVAAAPALTSDDEMPQFNLVVGTGDADANGHVSPAATDHDNEGDDGSPVPEQHVTSRARLASGGAPAYPESARADGIEADVPLEIVVSPAGAVESARVLRPAGHGLDQAALDAVRTYRFTPATHDGHPVRVRMQWLVQFRLR
jgi:protein TonB